MAMNKYWEKETPIVMTTEKNQLRIYTQYGKIQVFPIVASAPNGVGKGATIDVETMKLSELNELQDTITKVIELAKSKFTVKS